MINTKLAFVVAISLAVVSSTVTFPEPGQNAYCDVTANYQLKQCYQIFQRMLPILKIYEGGDSVGGEYDVISYTFNSEIITTRSAYEFQYPQQETQDVRFTFVQRGANCYVTGRSIARFVEGSIDDNYRNFCNTYNPLLYTDVIKDPVSIGHCSGVPEDPILACTYIPPQFLQ